MRKITRRTFTAAAASIVAGGASSARAQTSGIKVYTLPVAADYTGPLANVIESWQAGQKAMLDWWNDTRGKTHGVRIDIKSYDTRYDPAVVARLWPEIMAAGNPLAYLGLGGADLVALMKRLPEDKVPLILSTAMIGPLWVPNAWYFTFRPTYTHEFAGLFAYLQSKLPEKRPLRIATIGTQGVPAYVDPINGFVALAKAHPDKFQVVSSQWIEAKPITIVNQVQDLSKAKPDLVTVHVDTGQASALLKALKELGLKTPIVTSSHNGLTELAPLFPMSDLEGSFSVFAFAPFNDPKLQAAATFAKYNKGPGKWGMIAAQTSAQMLLFLAAVERAIGVVGANNLTGQAIYNALIGGPFEPELLQGLLPRITLTKAAPFPTENLGVRAMTVRGGKIESLTPDWLPVPALSKW